MAQGLPWKTYRCSDGQGIYGTQRFVAGFKKYFY